MLLGARIASMAGGGPGPTPPTPSYWGLTFTAEQAPATISMSVVGSPPALSGGLMTSVDGGASWQTFTPGSSSITLSSVGDTVLFKSGGGGNTAFSIDGNNRRSFLISGKCAASGSIMSLLSDDETLKTISGTAAFRGVFQDCMGLTRAPDLPATTLSDNCYQSLFNGCSYLTTPPHILPATSVPTYAYHTMFYNCSALTTAPEIKATAIGYYSMAFAFGNCQSLAVAPDLPATGEISAGTVVSYAYYAMFTGCTSLTTTPRIGLTKMATSTCAFMFDTCTALTSAELAISDILGDLITSMQCMFIRCSSLSSIKVAWSNWNTGYNTSTTANWVNGVAAAGTFYCPAALGTGATIARGNDRCPSGWTVVNI